MGRARERPNSKTVPSFLPVTTQKSGLFPHPTLAGRRSEAPKELVPFSLRSDGSTSQMQSSHPITLEEQDYKQHVLPAGLLPDTDTTHAPGASAVVGWRRAAMTRENSSHG